jgi:co-chaperonin GroES (HSP10)
MKTFKCLHDRIVVKPIEKKTQTESGLSLPETDQKQDPIGQVMAVGTGVPLHNIKLNITGDLSEESLSKLESIVKLIDKGREMRVKVGDEVQFGLMAGTTLNVPEDYSNLPAGKYIIIREADVFGRLIEESQLTPEEAKEYNNQQNY